MLVGLGALLAAPAWVSAALIGASLATGALGLGIQLARKMKRAEPVAGEIVLGRGRDGRQVTIAEQDLSAHGLILGASGSGKTTTLLTVLDQQIRGGKAVVAIDMKGSPAFAVRLAEAAAASGRPFKLWTPDGPAHWNPLGRGNATELKDKLICTERFTEPHYQRAAERYLQSLLQVIRARHPEQAATLEEVVALMDPRRLKVALRGVHEPLSARVQDYLDGLASDQLSAVRGLQTRLAIITESECGRWLAPVPVRGDSGEATVDLAAALEGPEVVLFSLNSSRYGQFAAQLGTLIVQDLVCATGNRLQRHARAARPATVAIDEFSGIGGEHVVALFARGREAGVSGLLATQEMADLDRAGAGVRDQILGNTAIKLILRQDVPGSALTVAQLAGTEPRWEETRQLGPSVFRGRAARGTRREVERYVIHPSEIKSLPTGDAVLISKLRGDRARTVSIRAPGAGGQEPRARRSAPGSRAVSVSAPPGREPRYPGPGVTR
jgi:type IV secretory pathway TraG/TraD family ATPase VirD4